MEAPIHRSCVVCRAQKTRCIPDETDPDACQRCVRLGKQCVFTAIQKRKPRRTNDTRVAELERELRALRTALQNREADSYTAPTSAGTEEAGTYKNAGQELLKDGNTQSQFQRSAGFVAPRSNVKPTHDRGAEQGAGDVVDQGLLSPSAAHQLLESYQTKLYPHYPAVYISPICTADQLRRTKPILFLAIMAASTLQDSPDLSTTLGKRLVKEFANRIVVNSEKSVELIESLLVSSIWFQLPGRFDQLKFCDYMGMATSMAMNIGIHTGPSKKEQGSTLTLEDDAQSIHSAKNASTTSHSQDINHLSSFGFTDNFEAMRTLLAVYMTSANIAMTFRRPATMRMTTYINDCLQNMDRSPSAASGDSNLTRFTRLFMIAEDFSTSFRYHDTGAIASILDTETQLMMTAFNERLTKWRHGVIDSDFSPALRITYHTIRLYLNELVLHIDHSPDNFKAPYRMRDINPSTEIHVPISPAVTAISHLVESSRALLDAFLSIDAVTIRTLPVVYFVRVTFAAFILTVLHTSATSNHSHLAGITDLSDLGAQHYVDKVVLHTRGAIGPNNCRMPAVFYVLLLQIQHWYGQSATMQEKETGNPASNREHDVLDNRITALFTDGLNNLGYSSDKTGQTSTARGPKSSTSFNPIAVNNSMYNTFPRTGSTTFTNDQVPPNAATDFEPSLLSWEALLQSTEQMIHPDDEYRMNRHMTPTGTATTGSDGAQDSQWPLQLDNMEWDDNFFGFPGATPYFAQNEQNAMTSCPTQ